MNEKITNMDAKVIKMEENAAKKLIWGGDHK